MAVPSLWKQMMHRNIHSMNTEIEDQKHFSERLVEFTLRHLEFFFFFFLLVQNIKLKAGWTCNSMVENLLSMCKGPRVQS